MISYRIVAWSVCLFIGHTGELRKQVGPRKLVLSGVNIEHIATDVTSQMRPFAKLLWTLVY